MTSPTYKPMPHIEVIPAVADQEPILANLLELYAHDFSEFHDIELSAEGKFGYKDLSFYWRESDRHPFLLKVDSKLAGFALVKRGQDFWGDETVWDMAEFFVVRRYRRRGIGMVAAHELWRRFPGMWQVRVMESNHAAHQFWQRAIAAFTGQRVHSSCIEKAGGSWRVFTFESRPVS